MVYLTVLDVGAHMPPRMEIPEIVSMRDGEIVAALEEAEHARKEATRQLTAYKQAHLHAQNGHDTDAQHELERLQQAIEEASEVAYRSQNVTFLRLSRMEWLVQLSSATRYRCHHSGTYSSHLRHKPAQRPRPASLYHLSTRIPLCNRSCGNARWYNLAAK
jgi:hypothetical protein